MIKYIITYIGLLIGCIVSICIFNEYKDILLAIYLGITIGILYGIALENEK
jgi:hypothetical protein